MFAGEVTVGLQIGGLQAFTQGWAAAAAAVAKAAQAMLSQMSEWIEQQSEIGDALDEMSERLDISVEKLSGLDLALKLNGSSLGEFEASMRAMVRVVDDSRNGMGTAVQALDRVGLSVRDIAGLNNEQVFDRIASGIKNIADPSERAAAALEVFGRTGTQLLPAIMSNLEATQAVAKEFGTLWTREEADTASALQDAWQLVREAASGLGKELALGLMPYLTDVFNISAMMLPRFTNWIRSVDGVGQAVRWCGDQWVWYWKTVNEVAEGVSTGIKSLASSVTSNVMKMTTGVIEARAKWYTAIAEWMKSVTSLLPEGDVGKFVARQFFGIDADTLREETTRWENAAKGANMVFAAAAGERRTMAQGIYDSLTGVSLIVPHAIEHTSDLVLKTTANFEALADAAGQHFRKMSSDYKATNKDIEKTQRGTVNAMSKVQAGFRDFAVDTFVSILQGASGSFSEILKSLLGSLGPMAIQEGVFHMLAGQAKLASGITAVQGRAEIAAGRRLLIWGAVATAIGGAMGGGGGGGEGGGAGEAAGGGGGGESGGGGFTREGPGFEAETPEARARVQVIVQGSMFDSRETWQRIGELAREHSDHDITIVQQAVAA